MTARAWCVIAAAVVALGGGGCRRGSSTTATTTTTASATPTATSTGTATSASTSTSTSTRPFVAGDAERGKSLVEKYECSRCHDGTGTADAPIEKDCVRCHQDILSGKFKAPAAAIEKWKKHVGHVRDAPSLAAAGKRLGPAWIEAFLQRPYDLRPHLVSSMPRLAMGPEDARDVATWIVRESPAAATDGALEGADVARGRTLVEQRACGTCHVLTGAAPLPVVPVPLDTAGVHRPEVSLAPDLRHARDRMTPAALVAWLADPPATKPGTLMPRLLTTREEARDVAAYLLRTPLAQAPPAPLPPRLPPLDRRVTFAEVTERVLGKTCRHCHTDPDGARGDGGPGMTGGFGFAPRRLDLSTHRGASAGLLDAAGKRKSVFAPAADGTPLLVASLLARQEEEAGRPRADVRGMPLGLPALSPEDVQIVATWVAQGRPK